MTKNKKENQGWVLLSLLFIVIFIIVCAVVYFSTRAYVIATAQEDIENMLLQHRGLHSYVQLNALPELEKLKSKGDFKEGAYSPVLFSSSYMVRNLHNYFNDEREKNNLPPLYYKLAATNPRNIVNKADDFELELLKEFNENREITSFKEIVEEDGKEYLYMAIPFMANEQRCMACHGPREDSPKDLQKIYAGQGGFDETIGDIRAIESLKVPLDHSFGIVYIILLSTAICVVVFAGLMFLNLRLRKMAVARAEVLSLTENKFRDLVETTSDWIWESDDTSVFVYASPKVKDLLGYEVGEILGRKPTDFMSGQEAERVALYVKETFSNKDIITRMENIMIHKDGHIVIIETSGVPIIDDNGLLTGYRGVARDVTEQKKAVQDLLHSEEQFRTVFESAQENILIWDEKLDYLFANQASIDYVGVTRDKVIGKNIRDGLGHVPEFMNLWIGRIEKVFRTGQSFHFEDQSVIQGQILYSESSMIPICGSQGEVTAVCVIHRDITERVRAEREREILLQSLEAKNKELQSIAYVASHDLRSPLVNIQGFSHELQDNCEQLIKLYKEKQRAAEQSEQIKLLLHEYIPESLKYIIAGTDKISNLIDGLLEVSRIGSAKVNTVGINVNKLIEQVQCAMEFQIKEGNFEINIGDLPDCLGDPVMLNQVLTNIVGNALKYAEPARKGQLNINGHIEDDRSIYCFQDNGIGIDSANCDKVFEMFHRLDPKGSVSGQGLGLTIVMRLLDRMDGRVWVESQKGEGSKFFVSLPHTKE
ncbi:MAG: PAS domain S-box protein [Phycisphaerae bacterium]|nr:PAS domain S-box protein [Phycisphaerae bacterium]